MITYYGYVIYDSRQVMRISASGFETQEYATMCARQMLKSYPGYESAVVIKEVYRKYGRGFPKVVKREELDEICKCHPAVDNQTVF